MPETVAENLWGDYLHSLHREITPRTILEQQASILTQATNGQLVGKIDDMNLEDEFRFDLDIVVPPLNNYRYTLLKVRHEIDLYPLSVTTHRSEDEYICRNEQEFRGALTKILQSESTQRVLTNLLSQIPA